MKIKTFIAIVAMFFAYPVGNAIGQTGIVSKGGHAASAQVVLSGTIVSTIGISVNGSSSRGSSALALITGSGTAGSIRVDAFGDHGSTVAGEKQEVRDDNGSFKGSYLVATVTVAAVFTGFGTATAALDIQRAAPCSGPPDIPCAAPGYLFFARPPQRGRRPSGWPRWNGYPDRRYGSTVSVVPGVTYVPGSGNLAEATESGEQMEHQLAVWIPVDSAIEAFAAAVRYTATIH